MSLFKFTQDITLAVISLHSVGLNYLSECFLYITVLIVSGEKLDWSA